MMGLRAGAAMAALLLGAAGCGEGDGAPALALPTPTSVATAATPSPAPTGSPAPTPIAGLFTIATGADRDGPVAVGSDGSNWLVAFGSLEARTEPDVVAVRVSSSGSVLDDAPILVSDVALLSSSVFNETYASYSYPAISFDGQSYVLVFFGEGFSGETGQDYPGGQVVFATRITTAGEIRAPITSLVENLTFGAYQPALIAPPAAAAAGAQLFALWSIGLLNPQYCFSPRCQLAISAITVSYATGAPEVGLPFTLAGIGGGEQVGQPRSAPAISSSGATALAAWGEVALDQEGVETMAIRGALLAPGQPVEPLHLASVDRSVDTTAVAAGSDEYLVAWVQAQEVRTAIYRPGTDAFDPEQGFVVASGATAKRLSGVAFAQSTYLVVWTEDGGRVRVARVSAAGEPAEPILLGDGAAGSAAVASDGSVFLVAFLRSEGASAETAEVIGRFVAPD